MKEQTIYRDIRERTDGNFYIGVVGPVRTGKSTFIRRFAEELILPNIGSENDRSRTRDSIPQGGGGRTVMTTEPKFIPDEAVAILPDGTTTLSVRLVDCVGFPVDDALGLDEAGGPRLVSTPWSDSPIPFAEAAEIGTRKVISEHSTVCMLVTTDGSFGGIPREKYIPAEEKAIAELNRCARPYVIVLNSADPTGERAERLGGELEKKYDAPVALVDCTRLDSDDLLHILGQVLSGFPLTEVRFALPAWLSALPDDHRLRTSLLSAARQVSGDMRRMGDLEKIPALLAGLSEDGGLGTWTVAGEEPGTGKAKVTVDLPRGLFLSVLSEETGFPFSNDADLFRRLRELSTVSEKWARIEPALRDCEAKGYGIVMPEESEMKLEDPKIVRRGGGYGVNVRASAPSIHLIRATVETELNPLVGTEEQSEELAGYLASGMEEEDGDLRSVTLFGKSLSDLTAEGIRAKLNNLPEEARGKIADTLERIINEGASGLICVLL